MKPIKLFILRNCPFCVQALDWQRRLLEEYPEYRKIPVEVIDEREQAAIADSYGYYYVPTYYVDGQKLHEGVATKRKIQAVFDAAMR